MMATDVRARLEASLPPGDRVRLEQVRSAAAELGTPAYLAGGLVRDVLLGRPADPTEAREQTPPTATDMDFVLLPQDEGDPPAPRLARALAGAQGGTVTVHGACGTATWLAPDGRALDFATARTEAYAHPGALPTVAPASSLATDLRRRDFTFNAMAIRIDGAHYGELVDPYGGQDDLAAGLVRVLHPRSFQDDPTRLFRAVRYALRLGFRLAEDTERLLPAALPVAATLSGERARHELELVFGEAKAPAVLARLNSVGALAALHPALRWSPAETAEAAVAANLPRPAWEWPAALDLSSIYLTLLLRQAARGEAASALARLSVTRAVNEAVLGALGLVLSGTRPSEVVAQLDALNLDAVVAAYVAQPAARATLDAYLARWRFVRPQTSGDDLVALGLPPGPRYKHILWRLRAARLDGEIEDEAGELRLVRELADLE